MKFGPRQLGMSVLGIVSVFSGTKFVVGGLMAGNTVDAADTTHVIPLVTNDASTPTVSATPDSLTVIPQREDEDRENEEDRNTNTTATNLPSPSLSASVSPTSSQTKSTATPKPITTTVPIKTTTPTPTPTKAPTPTTPSVAHKYKNGTYNAVGSYGTEDNLTESIGVTLTVTNDTVSSVSIETMADNSDSLKWQLRFKSGISSAVVGKSLDYAATIGKVNGSSDTPKGFRSAVNQIKSKAL